jgi:hypothetical protein
MHTVVESNQAKPRSYGPIWQLKYGTVAKTQHALYLYPASYARAHYPHAQPQPNGTQRCLQTHTDKHDAGNAEATWEL